MRSLAQIVLVSAAVFMASISVPQAAVFSFSHMLQKQMEHVAFREPVLGPFAYTHFCIRYADDCREHGHVFRKPKAVVLTEERKKQLFEINRAVNATIAPRHYVNDTSFDTWRVAPRSGDCNDYAVTKRHELLALGWPSRALLLSEVVTSWGEHHLVLLVRTAEEDLVLDNLNANIKNWSKTPYQWVRVQSPDMPALWTTIDDPHARHVS